MSQDAKSILHAAYTFVRSVEANKAAAAVTMDHLLDAQITNLKGGDTQPILDAKGESVGNRISQLDALTELETSLNKLVSAIKAAGSDPAKLAALGITNNKQAEGT